jgi:hypothetical protein
MTEDSFIYMHTNSIVNATTKLSINITQALSVQAGNLDPAGRVTSIILGQQAFSVNGDETNTDLDRVLEQVERIRFTFQISTENDIIFDQQITDRSYYSAAVANGNPFFYFQFSPFLIEGYQNPPYVSELYDYQSIVVSITPYLIDITVGNSEYNALIGNATNNRESKIRVESNRVEDGVFPTNWEAIMSGSALPATVQDSMYDDTGWTNARYNGSLITSKGNANISPAFTGTPFRGEIFSKATEDDYICTPTRKDQDILDLYHTGPTTPESQLPTFVTRSLGVTLQDSMAYGKDERVVLSGIPVTGSLTVGNIIKIVNQNQAGYELFLVEQVKRIPPLVNLTCIRGYGQTEIFPHGVGADVFLVDPYNLFRFEEESKLYIRLINTARILVQGNNTIVDTDRFGNVINSVTCSLS